MKTADFDFDLPEDRIALRPVEPRDSARLLVVRDGVLDDRIVRDLPDLLQPGDALVFNDTRVIPARLSGVRTRLGPDGEPLTVEVEATLHHRDAPDVWSAFMKPGKRLKPGDRIAFSSPFPSRGKGRGWGGGTASQTSPEDSVGVSEQHPTHPASTPTQPF
ncbi:hypothetical protein IP78_08275, partial [Brevundimonas sp. AAP58]|uniref:S-adenosylmethionine:tRNA ribosyltransferase-isomerase n=1 Tax=Brevundimonas sp. AAP58 TaxID=1523422 RepID=UPI0006CC27D1